MDLPKLAFSKARQPRAVCCKFFSRLSFFFDLQKILHSHAILLYNVTISAKSNSFEICLQTLKLLKASNKSRISPFLTSDVDEGMSISITFSTTV